jgi:hypothetical protein
VLVLLCCWWCLYLHSHPPSRRYPHTLLAGASFGADT